MSEKSYSISVTQAFGIDFSGFHGICLKFEKIHCEHLSPTVTSWWLVPTSLTRNPCSISLPEISWTTLIWSAKSVKELLRHFALWEVYYLNSSLFLNQRLQQKDWYIHTPLQLSSILNILQPYLSPFYEVPFIATCRQLIGHWFRIHCKIQLLMGYSISSPLPYG